MLHTTNTPHRGAYTAEAAVFWIFAGIFLVIGFWDVPALLAVGLTVLAVAFAIVTAARFASHT